MDRPGRAGRPDLTTLLGWVARWVPAFDPAPDRPASTRWRWVAAFVAALVVLTALALLRQPHIHVWNTIWAEDGVVFAHDANAGHALLTLFKGYAGYANLAPRLLALPTAVVPVSQFDRALAVASAAFDVLLALFVFRMTAGVIRSLWLRGLLLCMTALLPVLYIEANASVSNVNWTLLFAAFWAVIATADRRSDIVLRALVIFVAITSTALTVLVLPLAIVVAAGRKGRAQLVVLGAFLVGAVIQLAASLATEDTTPAGVTNLSDLGPIFGTRVAGSLLVGEQPLADLWRNHGSVFAIGAVVVLATVLGLLAIRADRDARLFAILAVVQTVLLFAVPIALRGTRVMRLTDGAFNLNGSRYLIAPLLVLLSAALVLVDRRQPSTHPARASWLQGLVVAHGLVLIATSYALAGKRSQGPKWEPTVQAAQETCRSGDVEQASFMLISPGLYMQLDCDRIGS